MKTEILGLSPGDIGKLMEENMMCDMSYYDILCVTGIPAIGKTSVARQVCEKLGIPGWVIRPIQHETVEYTGVPFVRDPVFCEIARSLKAMIAGEATEGDFEVAPLNGQWVPFGELLPTDPEWEGMIFIDEFTQLDISQQKVMAGVLDKAGVAGQRIPKGARFVVAGNRQQDRAGAGRLLSIVESRCTQIEMLFSIDDWREWAMANNVHEVVVSFADFYGADKFCRFDSSSSVNPLPRTWEKVSNKLHRAGPNADTSKNNPIMKANVAGSVGVGPAVEFLAFREHYAALHGFVDTALNNPNAVQIDHSNLSACHCMVGAMSTKLREMNGQLTDDKLLNLITLGGRFSNMLEALLQQKLGAQTILRLGKMDEGREWMDKYSKFHQKVR